VRLWSEFVAAAPQVAAVFERRHRAAGKLCMLATVRADGSPRVSPVEPRIFADRLWIVGMPGTQKFRDLGRDPRFCLHTATVDTRVTDGDAKLFGRVEDVQDEALHERFAVALYEEIGLDLRGRRFTPFFGAVLTGASSVAVAAGGMEVTIWRPGEGEQVVRKE